MNLLEYFKLYPLIRMHVNAPNASEAMVNELSVMDSVLNDYIPSGIDRRTEYRLTDEKEFIHLHCIEGISVEQAADRMCISRDTAYRIRRRLCKKEAPNSLATCFTNQA